MSTGNDQRPGDARDTFASILAGCRPLFPPALLDPAGWERLLDRAGRLPRSVADDASFGFEFHLGEPRSEADLFVVVPPGSDLSRHYIREGGGVREGKAAWNLAAEGGCVREGGHAPERGRAEPGSAASALAAGLQEQAGNPESYLARSVSCLVLEYDLAGLAPGRPPPPPGVFLAPRDSAPGSREGFAEHSDPEGLLAALAALVGWNGHEEMLGTVERIYAALPERGFVFQAGALPGRSPKAFRILVKGVAAEGVPALLEKLQWPGPTAAAADVLAAMDDLIDRVAVSLDVTARGLGPRLGLELYRPMRWFAADRKGWNPVIDRIEERGWCLPAKAGGLRRWPGIERLLGGGGTYLVRQGTSHVKVVVERGARTVAKAYAGMDVRPYDVASNLDSDAFAVEVASGNARAN